MNAHFAGTEMGCNIRYPGRNSYSLRESLSDNIPNNADFDSLSASWACNVTATIGFDSMTKEKRLSSSAKADNEMLTGINRKSDYVDHFLDPIGIGIELFSQDSSWKKHGQAVKTHPFPYRLYKVLEEAEQDGYDDIISWLPHGRAFLILDRERFMKTVMSRYFSASQFGSFCRQLSWYNFSRIRHGVDKGAWYHQYFLRGRPDLTSRIPRAVVANLSKSKRKQTCQNGTDDVQSSSTASSSNENRDNTDDLHEFYHLPFCIPLLDAEINWLSSKPSPARKNTAYDMEAPV